MRRMRWSRDDSGVAMVLVMAWSVLMLGLVLVVSTAVINQIRPSDRSEQAYAALSAAEAGLADLEARLQVGSIISVTDDANNEALRGWVPVPGGNTSAEFTYAIDATKSGAVGEVRAYSTGRAGDQVRTIEAVLSKRSTLDYVYLSDIESPSPDTPGVYSTREYSLSGITYQEAARLLCARRWVEPGPVAIDSGGRAIEGGQRNLRFCNWAGIFSNEQIIGRIHTNDVWWLQDTDLSGSLDPDSITSSCRSVDEGLQPGDVGCSAEHRYITASSIRRSSTPGRYQGDSYRPSGIDITQRNPGYDTILDLPESPDLLKRRAAETGCIYTGPTRLRFAVEGGIGYMYVTSPSTKLTRAGCDGEGGDGTRLQSSPTSQSTARVKLDDFSDLVVFVQDVRPTSESNLPGEDYSSPESKFYWEKENRWASGSEPTCATKGSGLSANKYPYVIPNDPGERAGFGGGSNYDGFPSEDADRSSPWYGSTCASGDMYVQGDYKGAIMLTSDNNVVLTSSLRDSQQADPSARAGAPDYGKPSPASTSTLGIAAGRFAYIYRPITDGGQWVDDWRSSNADNPVFNFALLAIQHCFGSQDYDQANNNGFIYLWGSIAQKFRCAVGISSGSGLGKVYKYDDRLSVRTPPYMLELSDEPWGDERTGELTLDTQRVGQTVTWPLLNERESLLSVRNVKLASAPNPADVVWSAAGSQVTIASTTPGLVAIVFEVRVGDAWQTRRLVTLVE